jgi:hypothetical protein
MRPNTMRCNQPSNQPSEIPRQHQCPTISSPRRTLLATPAPLSLISACRAPTRRTLPFPRGLGAAPQVHNMSRLALLFVATPAAAFSADIPSVRGLSPGPPTFLENCDNWDARNYCTCNDGGPAKGWGEYRKDENREFKSFLGDDGGHVERCCFKDQHIENGSCCYEGWEVVDAGGECCSDWRGAGWRECILANGRPSNRPSETNAIEQWMQAFSG